MKVSTEAPALPRERKTVAVVGAGFAGLAAAKGLANTPDVDVVALPNLA